MFEFLEEGFRLFGDVVERATEDFGNSQKRTYDASFIKERELLSSSYSGFCLTGAKNLSSKHSYQGALVVGSTGTGKSASVLIPSLFTMKKASCIVNDPSGELYTKTSGYLAKNGFTVKALNFADPKRSDGYNPIVRAKTSQEINKLANMLISTSLESAKGDKFWESMGASLLAMLIGILKTEDEKYQTLFNVRHLLNAFTGNPKGLNKLFSDNADALLFAEFLSFRSLDEKVLSSTLATAKAALQGFADTNISFVTSFDSIDMAEFRKRPTVLFVQAAIGDMKYLAPLISIFFQQCIHDILSRFPEDGDRDLYFLLDEASSLRVPILPLAMANVRKYRCGILLMIQSEQQIINNYGKADADAILANCYSKVYFSGQDFDTCRKLESILGKREITDTEKKKSVVPLMTSDAIRTMRINQGILLAGHHKPVQLRFYPYYENPTYRRYAALPTPEPPMHAPPIALIHLEQFDDEEGE